MGAAQSSTGRRAPARDAIARHDLRRASLDPLCDHGGRFPRATLSRGTDGKSPERLGIH